MIVYKALLLMGLIILTIAKYELEDCDLIHILIDVFILVVFLFLMFLLNSLLSRKFYLWYNKYTKVN